MLSSPDRTYLMHTCVSGTRLNVDIYTFNHTDTTAIAVAQTSNFTFDISGAPSIQNYQHIVLQLGAATGFTLSAFVNGVAVPAITYTPPGCSFTMPTGINPDMPVNLDYVNHFRFYNRVLTSTEALANASNDYFIPSNTAAMTWYRFNVPAAGSPGTIDGGTDQLKYSPVYPTHNLVTTYAYNSTNQATQQKSPDGGTNRFWYDLLSRLVISQNDKQQPNHDYSYTNFDALGRITEVGQKNQTTVNIGNPDYLADAAIANFNSAGANTQITTTYYDAPAPATGGIQSVTQDNLRKRVAASTYRDTQTGDVQQATYYNYDLDGNVKTLYQQIAGLSLKRIDYEYDLVSGKVNFVSYQDGQPDQFYYKYNYDADNRITEAWTGTSATIKPGGGSYLLNGKMDASYQYYLHGPLARMELGDVYGKVQGSDYAYTLQGWLKGVNRQNNSSTVTNDIGQDGIASNAIARDAYGYSLGYYHDDYKPIGGSSYTALSAQYQQAPTDTTGQNLYNGNISTMVTSVSGISSPFGNTYHYDQLNRLAKMRGHTSLDLSNWSASSITRKYQETLTYDGNGNIKTYIKNSPDPSTGGVRVNVPTYNYPKVGNGPGAKQLNNRLAGITDPYGTDPSTGTPSNTDISTNYAYDPIGNLTADTKAGITNIDWTVYGKIKTITKASGNLNYTYDPAGQRATKKSGSITTWYVRDASGNTMAVYDNTHDTLTWREQDLYGSSRLGLWTPNVKLVNNNASTVWDTIGHKQYELTNHLGNVLATITDKRQAIGGPGGTVSYYTADVSTSQLYYSFGAVMPYLSFTTNQYRYGFNGKENDNEVKKDQYGGDLQGSEQDYGMRIYDPRVGRFLSVDPLTIKYPALTPYQFASNRPIDGVDQDGLEYYKYNPEYNATIVFPPFKKSDEDKIIPNEFEAAMRAHMNVMIANSLNDVIGYMKDKGAINKYILFTGHGSASYSTLRMTNTLYSSSLLDLKQVKASLKELSKYIQKDGSIILLGCFQSTPPFKETAVERDKNGNITDTWVRTMDGQTLTKKLSAITDRNVIANPSETYGGADEFTGHRPLADISRGHNYSDMSNKFSGQWSVTTPAGLIIDIGAIVITPYGGWFTMYFPKNKDTETKLINTNDAQYKLPAQR